MYDIFRILRRFMMDLEEEGKSQVKFTLNRNGKWYITETKEGKEIVILSGESLVVPTLLKSIDEYRRAKINFQ